VYFRRARRSCWHFYGTTAIRLCGADRPPAKVSLGEFNVGVERQHVLLPSRARAGGGVEGAFRECAKRIDPPPMMSA
jgi:hypothetical protein